MKLILLETIGSKGAIIKILSSCEDSDFPSLEIRNFIQNRQEYRQLTQKRFLNYFGLSAETSRSIIPQMLDDPEPSLRKKQWQDF